MSVVECNREYGTKCWSTAPLIKNLYTIIAYRQLIQNIICIHITAQKNILKNNCPVRRYTYYKYHTTDFVLRHVSTSLLNTPKSSTYTSIHQQTGVFLVHLLRDISFWRYEIIGLIDLRQLKKSKRNLQSPCPIYSLHGDNIIVITKKLTTHVVYRN